MISVRLYPAASAIATRLCQAREVSYAKSPAWNDPSGARAGMPLMKQTPPASAARLSGNRPAGLPRR